MTQFVHPPREDFTLTGILAALGDATRFQIVKNLADAPEGKNCSLAAPFPHMARSTLTGHFRVLRGAGLVHSHKRGVEFINVLRVEDVEARFPGLLKQILAHEAPCCDKQKKGG
jgi:DNA-binding transcriptional ArsR family regulator